MDEILNLFEYRFFLNAVIAAALSAVSCGIVGTYVVSRRIVFVSGGITHASFGGIGIAYYMGLNPVLGAAVFAVLTGLGIEGFTKKAKIRNDSVIAMLWSLGMAIGIIFIYLTPGYSPNLMSYLFGNILTIRNTDLYLLGMIAILALVFSILLYRKIVYIAFDEEFAKTRGVNVDLIKYLMMILVSLTIVFNIKSVGIILLISLLTIPQNTANLFTRDYKKIIYFSVIIAFAGSLAGLVISYFLDIPSGAAIIFNLAVIYLFARLVKNFTSGPGRHKQQVVGLKNQS